jgi:hypothetical protein
MAGPNDADEQPQTARQGAEAAGGISPQPGDPTSPAAAAARAERTNREMREAGFGDHKGGSIDAHD